MQFEVFRQQHLFISDLATAPQINRTYRTRTKGGPGPETGDDPSGELLAGQDQGTEE